MKILHVNSSILGQASVSQLLSAAVVERLCQLHPGAEVIYRDLAAAGVEHLSGAHLAVAHGASPENDRLARDIEQGATSLQEFLAADIVVIGAPMYNFSIPSQLKAWIDRLAIAGQTFRYTERGPEGLCNGKRVVIASSRGNVYSAGSSNEAADYQETYLHTLFSFLGINDFTVIRAEGIALSDDARAQAIDRAKQEIAAMTV